MSILRMQEFNLPHKAFTNLWTFRHNPRFRSCDEGVCSPNLDISTGKGCFLGMVPRIITLGKRVVYGLLCGVRDIWYGEVWNY
jgi:hypothetical protein